MTATEPLFFHNALLFHLLKLDATLGELIPQITDTGKQTVTVRELLYHETGMPAALNMFDVMIDPDSYRSEEPHV